MILEPFARRLTYMAYMDYSAVEKELNQKLFLHPTDIDTLLKLAAFHIDNPTQAHYFSSEILKIDPYNLPAFIIYVDMEHNWLGKFDDKELLKKLLSFSDKYPENGYIDLMLAEHYEIAHQSAKVRLYLQRSIKKNSSLVRNNKLLALYYYYHDHNYTMAKKLFQKALSNIISVYADSEYPSDLTNIENLILEKYYENIMTPVNYQILLENIKTCTKKIKSKTYKKS